MTPKAKQFLTELQSLLKKYDAEMTDMESWQIKVTIDANSISDIVYIETTRGVVNSRNLFNRIIEDE